MAAAVGTPISYMKCKEYPKDGDTTKFLNSLYGNVKPNKNNNFKWQDPQKDTCYNVYAIWVFSIILCILYVLSGMMTAVFWLVNKDGSPRPGKQRGHSHSFNSGPLQAHVGSEPLSSPGSPSSPGASSVGNPPFCPSPDSDSKSSSGKLLPQVTDVFQGTDSPPVPGPDSGTGVEFVPESSPGSPANPPLSPDSHLIPKPSSPLSSNPPSEEGPSRTESSLDPSKSHLQHESHSRHESRRQFLPPLQTVFPRQSLSRHHSVSSLQSRVSTRSPSPPQSGSSLYYEASPDPLPRSNHRSKTHPGSIPDADPDRKSDPATMPGSWQD